VSSLTEPNFISSDIDLFWEVYNASENLATEDFQTLYINRGTKGLKDYAELKDLASGLRFTLDKRSYVKYYNGIQENTLDIAETIDISRTAFLKLEDIYPKTNFFNVYFLIGAMSAGGRISNNGLLIAVEMFSKDQDTDLGQLNQWHQQVVRNKEYLPSITVHEFIHMQQKRLNYQSVLEKSISEGMADFIAFHLLNNRPFMNEHLHSYGNPVEEQIWNEFNNQKEMKYQNTEWLYTGKTTSQGHPADMGYYVGFKILESYSSNFDSIEDAIIAMLSATDYKKIFKDSNYASKFD
jgi:hypothetical protein